MVTCGPNGVTAGAGGGGRDDNATCQEAPGIVICSGGQGGFASYVGSSVFLSAFRGADGGNGTGGSPSGGIGGNNGGGSGGGKPGGGVGGGSSGAVTPTHGGNALIRITPQTT